jgi:hypothetical protein
MIVDVAPSASPRATDATALTLMELPIQSSLAACRMAAAAFGFWAEAAGTWSEACAVVLRDGPFTGAAEAAAVLCRAAPDLVSRTCGEQLRSSGATAPLLSDA